MTNMDDRKVVVMKLRSILEMFAKYQRGVNTENALVYVSYKEKNPSFTRTSDEVRGDTACEWISTILCPRLIDYFSSGGELKPENAKKLLGHTYDKSGRNIGPGVQDFRTFTEYGDFLEQKNHLEQLIRLSCVGWSHISANPLFSAFSSPDAICNFVNQCIDEILRSTGGTMSEFNTLVDKAKKDLFYLYKIDFRKFIKKYSDLFSQDITDKWDQEAFFLYFVSAFIILSLNIDPGCESLDDDLNQMVASFLKTLLLDSNIDAGAEIIREKLTIPWNSWTEKREALAIAERESAYGETTDINVLRLEELKAQTAFVKAFKTAYAEANREYDNGNLRNREFGLIKEMLKSFGIEERLPDTDILKEELDSLRVRFAPGGGRECVLERPLCGAKRPPVLVSETSII